MTINLVNVHLSIYLHLMPLLVFTFCSQEPTSYAACDPLCANQAVRNKEHSVYRSQWTNRHRDRRSPSSDQIRSLRKQTVSCEIILGIPTLSCLTKIRKMHALHSISQIGLWNQAVPCEIIPRISTCHVGWRHERSMDLSWFLRLSTSYISHTFIHMSVLLSIPRTASAFGINPPFQATQTGPVTDGFLLYRGRPGRGYHYPHRWDQEHEGEQDSPTSGRLHPQTPISWTTHAAPAVPHLAQRPMRPTHWGQTQ